MMDRWYDGWKTRYRSSRRPGWQSIEIKGRRSRGTEVTKQRLDRTEERLIEITKDRGNRAQGRQRIDTAQVINTSLEQNTLQG